MEKLDHTNSNWKAHHVSCTSCDSSDGVSINEDNSWHCFSCEAHGSSYDGSFVENGEIPKEKETRLTATGIAGALTDRKISADTAKKYVDRYGLYDYIESGQVEIISEVEEHVKFLSILSKSIGVLVPSYYPTTGEFVLLESLGMGKPIIAFNSGVHREILQHKMNAMVSKTGDLDDYASNIIEVSNNKDLRSSLSKGAQLLYRELTSVDKLRKNIPF